MGCMEKYNELIDKALKLNDDFKFLEAFDVLKQAKLLDEHKESAYIEAGKTCVLTKQYNSAVVLYIVGLLKKVIKPHFPNTIASRIYFDDTRHIGNALVLSNESVLNDVKNINQLSEEQMKLAKDTYMYSLLETAGKTYYDTYLDSLTKATYAEIQESLSSIGVAYVKMLQKKFEDNESLITYLLNNINW
jgi:hypothetical protein